MMNTFGTFGRGNEDDKIFLLLTYLRSVLIFIKHYSDSMCLSSSLSSQLRIISYLCEIDVRTPTSFWSSYKFIKFKPGVNTCINSSRVNSFII